MDSKRRDEFAEKLNELICDYPEVDSFELANVWNNDMGETGEDDYIVAVLRCDCCDSVIMSSDTHTVKEKLHKEDCYSRRIRKRVN